MGNSVFLNSVQGGLETFLLYTHNIKVYPDDQSIGLNEFDIISYVNTVTTLVLACGLLFQLPIVVYFTTRAGLVSSSLLRKYRKHAVIVILILGAMLTPPDPFSQVLIAIPLVMLYQVGIFIAKRVERKEADEEASELPKPIDS